MLFLVHENYQTYMGPLIQLKPVADLGGRAPSAPPLWTKISLISWGFSENIIKLLGRHPH